MTAVDPAVDRGTVPAPGSLEHRADTEPDAVAFVEGDRRVTLSDWERRAARLADGLARQAGLEAGDRVAIRTRNRVEWFETALALAKLGATAVSVGWRLTAEEVRYIVDNSEARALVSDAGDIASAALGWLSDEDGGLRSVIALGVRSRPPALDYEALIAAGDGPRRLAGGSPAGASIVYTSGTTGRPKGAVRELGPDRLAALGTTLADMFGKLDFQPGDRHLLCCPVYHAAPPFYAQFTLAGGGTVAIMDRFDPEQALRVIDAERITTTFMVPTMLNRIAGLPAAVKARYDLSSMRALISGGGPFPASLKQPVIELFGDGCLFDMYGSTETGNVTLLEPRDQLRKSGSVGRPLAGVEVRVLGSDGSQLPPGEKGELYIRSPMLVQGYHRDEAATRESMRDGFFTVGDVGYVDEEGYVFVVDRVKDMIISGGVNIYPAEIEDVLRSHPAVFDVAVIGVPHPDMGEAAKAIVQLEPGARASDEDLAELCESRLARYKVPHSFERTEDLPRSPFGKILKRELREPYWATSGRRI